MTRAQTVDVLNDSTTVQSRIDTVLAAPDLDWSNDSGWQPGDPLYDRPNPYLRYGDQWVRPLIQLIEDGAEWGDYARCEACQVSWSGPEACWLCGDPETERKPFPWAASTVQPAVWWDETHDWSAAMSAAMRPIVEQMNAMSRQFTEVSARFHFSIDSGGQIYRFADPEPITEASRESWIRANSHVWLVPEIAEAHAPTVAELEAARPLTSMVESIRIPAGAEITPVAPVPLPERVTGRASLPEVPRRYFYDRPVTERRRPR